MLFTFIYQHVAHFPALGKYTWINSIGCYDGAVINHPLPQTLGACKKNSFFIFCTTYPELVSLVAVPPPV